MIMKTIYSATVQELGQKAAAQAAGILRDCIKKNGTARLLLSTGASQFDTLAALSQEELDWGKVEMFHLDEYIGITEEHPASFVKYLKERFLSKVSIGAAHFVDTSGDVKEMIARLTAEIRKSPIDLGLIGIGENAHIAFNDPPADFDCEDVFIIVKLADSCRRQQLGEGWFKTLEDVPAEAVTMTVKQILSCQHIISAVPYAVKSQAVHDTLSSPTVTPDIPATILRTHDDCTLYVDKDSASLIDIGVYCK
jgi:glucosamine-6-phosphate deaminase